ncbi:MAG: T9SS type A sorting domain-containing protein [bacterium]|nr:T9SS type A sorting domain-containing protein [bacterium]
MINNKYRENDERICAMYKLIVKVVIATVIGLPLLSNPIVAGWERTYGGINSDVGCSVVQAQDGDYIIAGATSSYGVGGEDVWLIKTDATGNILWTRTYGGAGNDVGLSIMQTLDSGYIVAGITNSYGAGLDDIYLIKTNSNGDLVWTKTYGGTYEDVGLSIAHTLDEGCIITGSTESYGEIWGDVWLVRIGAAGDTLWTRTYGGNREDCGLSVRQTLDGGYIVTGRTASYGAGAVDVYLIKVDAEGVEESSNVKAQSSNLEIYPNPFTSVVSVKWSGISESQGIGIQIYDLSGRLVKTLITNHSPLTTAVTWDGTDASGKEVESGVYFCQLKVGDNSVIKKLIMMR